MGGKARSQPASYDRQARGYDDRAGLSSERAREVARAILSLGELGARDLLLECGAGTGEVGCELVAGHPRYLGFDRSKEMLAVFRKRSPAAPLSVADGGATWPVRARACRLVFASRAIHLLPEEHVIRECERVLEPGGMVVIGRVEIDRESVKAVMRRQMRRLLRERGLAARQGERNRDALLELATERGARTFEPLDVCAWQVWQSPADSLRAWQGKDGLGGVSPGSATQREILAELANWASDALGGLDTARPSREAYRLVAFQLPG